MTYNSRIRKNYSRSERGIALFFALGVLAVILITVMVFASRAITDRKVAAAYAARTEANNIAESAMGRALLSLCQNSILGTECYSLEQNGSQNSNSFDWLWKIESEDYKLRQNIPMRWQYVHKDGGTGPLLGRFAYHISGQNLLNLNALCTHPFCTAGCKGDKECVNHLGQSLAELEFDSSKFNCTNSGGSGVPFTKDALNATIGTGTPPPFTVVDFLLNALGIKNEGKTPLGQYFTVSDGAYMEEPDAWFKGNVEDPSKNVKDKLEFLHRFNLNRTDWDAITLAAITKGNTPFYNGETPQPNDSGISWFGDEGTDIEGNWPDANTKRNQIVANLINYCAPDTLPVVSNEEARARDWSDTVVPTYTGNKRTFYLNEAAVRIGVTAVPGSYELRLVWDGDTPKPFLFYPAPTFTLNLDLKAETIKMFENVLPGNYSVKFFGTIDIIYQENICNVSSYANSSSGEKTKSISLQSLPNTESTIEGEEPNPNTKPYLKYYLGDAPNIISIPVGTFATSGSSPQSDFSEFYKIKSLKLSDFKAIVSRKGVENVDYSNITDELSIVKEGFAISFGSDSNPTYLTNVSFQVNDPRHNLHAADWKKEEATEGFAGTLGSVNNTVTCKSQYDPTEAVTQDSEIVDDPAWLGDAKNQHISTAYIRHAPMQSLWELGAIHRAAPWQTINFKKPYNGEVTESVSFADDVSTKRLGAYRAGDFRLLDQVTFQKDGVVAGKFGRINLNAVKTPARDFAFDALFRGMPFHNNGHYDPAVETSKTPLAANQIKNAVSYLDASPDSRILYRRTDLFLTKSDLAFWKLFTEAPSGTGVLDTDALQEQMIGRIINLTKANTNYDSAAVSVLAQSIKDVGGVTMAVDWDETGVITGNATSAQAYTNAGYRKYGETRNVTDFFGSIPSLEREPIVTDFGQYDNGVDKITGTVKMSAYLIYDVIQDKWKLVRVKHEE